jgi:hypothetical protein
MVIKHQCDKCEKIAVWLYMPGRGGYYCDEHVSRGCSCNEDENGNQMLDKEGRELPCCEYDYFEKGIEVYLED